VQRLENGNNVDISSPKFDEAALKQHGISFSFIDEHPVTDLKQQCFGEFPLEDCQKPLVVCNELFGFR
jgi:hypothetical protein